MARCGSVSGSGTQISAALFALAARCRSTQLYDAFTRPPTNHFQNGGFYLARVVFQRLSPLSRAAYFVEQAGKLFSAEGSQKAGAFAVFRLIDNRRGE